MAIDKRLPKVSSKKPKTAEPTKRTFPIVGIGASAGGLEAFASFLAHLPVDTGMSFVLLQHLDPTHESMSVDILARATKMKVREVRDGMRAEPNCVYVMPPGFSMELFHGKLSLSPRSEVRGHRFAIDVFFKSLALDQKDRAIGIVLSGTGKDGTLGLMAIKSEGGFTIAQTPTTAKFEDMPRSAIASGSVDLILSPEQIAEELARIARHPYVSPFSIAQNKSDTVLASNPDQSMNHIFLLLRKACQVDFSLYKQNTIMRRIKRRMILNRTSDLQTYADLLSQNPKELKALYADILIHVTDFFRDPEAFAAIKTEVFPRLVEAKNSQAPIRIWVPGCATGEEAYSLAIALLEFLGDKASQTPVQIFASDISEDAVQKARTAEYPETIAETVPPEILGRYFLKLDAGGYKITKSVRDICVFSRHDLTSDPPFTKIDLVSCRNVLIYFTAALQKHVIPIFHYALNRKGYLWLGKSETIGGFSTHFSVCDKINKIYLRKDAPASLSLRFPSRAFNYGKQHAALVPKSFSKTASDLHRITEKAIHAEYPGVLVNEELEILQVLGHPTPFVELAPGAPSYHLLKMVRPELLRDLRSTIQEVQKQNATVKRVGLSLGDGRAYTAFNLNVIPILHTKSKNSRLYLILFEKVSRQKREKNQKTLRALGNNKNSRGKKDPYVRQLLAEISELQEFHRSLVEKFEATQEDLTASNEELQSANEELQSTNEELETAKEELQSGNEELTIVNDELQVRSIEETQTNNDLINLLGSVEIPIVMLGEDQRVRRFTPLAGKALNLIATDIGRPLSHLKLNFSSPQGEIDLEAMVTATIDTVKSQEVEVQDRDGHWFRLQVRPYKTVDNKIDGAVLALVDIHDLKQSLNEVKAAKREAERASRAKDLFLATLSHELRTPLTAILSWAQLLRSGKLDSQKSQKAVEVIEENGKAQAQLIDDLLDVSRIVSGKLALDTREIDPAIVLLAAVEAVRPTADLRSIKIETTLAPQVGTVSADPVRLQQIFWNLLTNAVKFSLPKSQVSISLQRISEKGGEKAKAMIKVEDSGKGIEPEFLPQIFDRFSQEDSSSIRLHGGLGLGLAIVRDLVELHGGTIRAESLGINRGATFTVLLPIKSNQAISGYTANLNPNLNHPEAVAKEQLSLDGIHVLIVEDEACTREAFGELLNAMGATVTTADSVREGLRAFLQLRPHVIVSDIAMPEEDGYALIKKIRSMPIAEGGATAALAITAYAGAEDIQQALDAGFQAHLSKPIDAEKLAQTIAKLAGRRN